MLLPRNTNPAYSTYFYGGLLLKYLSSDANVGIEFIDLFQQLNKLQRISIQSFVLALDWLYLIGRVQMDKSGVIRLVEKAQLSDSDKAIVDKVLAELSFTSKVYELILSLADGLDNIPSELRDIFKQKSTEHIKDVHKIS